MFNRVVYQEDQGGDTRNRQVVTTDAYQDFARRYQERYAQSLEGADLGFYAAYAYDATAVLIHAIQQVAVVDAAGNLVVGRQAMADAVRSTSGYPGITGAISLDAQGDRLP
jgi:ABC-type branched-subunit amino acid transport system substrate-binding protein